MSNIQLEPEFVRLIQGIYGDANLDGRTIKQLYQTWKSNPNLLMTAYSQKQKKPNPSTPIQNTSRLQVTPTQTQMNKIPQKEVGQDDLSGITNFNDAFKIARQRGLKQFKWRSTRGNPSGLFGTQLAGEIKKPNNTTKVQNKSTNKSEDNKSEQGNYNFNPININYPKSNFLQTTIGTNPFHRENPLNIPITIKEGDIRATPSSFWFGSVNPKSQLPIPKAVPQDNLNMRISPVLPTIKQKSPSLGMSIPQTTIDANLGTLQAVDYNTYGKYLIKNNITPTPEQSQNSWDWIIRGKSIRPYKDGGKLEDGQKAFVAYLIQVSGAQSEQELNDFIQSLGEDGLKQQYQQFVQTMQNGTQSAKKGAKLNYIKSLRGICPEGYELGYFKEGGQICAKCVEKREKMGGIPFRPIQGEKGTKVVQDFKKDLKNKKDKIKMSKKNPEKKENGGTLNINQGVLDIFKCGGKSKKKEKGGLVEKKAGIPIKEKYIDKDKCGKKMKKKK